MKVESLKLRAEEKVWIKIFGHNAFCFSGTLICMVHDSLASLTA
jgi:hypothetical protein